MHLCLSTAFDLGLEVGIWVGGMIVSSLKRRKEEELLNEFSSQPEDGIWLVSVSQLWWQYLQSKIKEHGLTQEIVLLPDVNSLWEREIRSWHVGIFYDIYVDYVRGHKKWIYKIIILPYIVANVIGDFVSNVWMWWVIHQCLSEGERREGRKLENMAWSPPK